MSPAARGTITLRRYALTIWLPRSKLKDSSKRAYESALNQLPTIADRPIAWVACHRTAVEDAIADVRHRQDHSGIYAAVKRCCDDAVKRDYLTAHKLAGLDVRRNYTRREYIPTTAAQRQALADGLGGRSLALWLLVGCGLRIGEAIAVKGSDFRDGFTALRVQRTADRGAATALKARQVGQYRDVPVPGWLAAKVREHVAAHGLGPLFPGRGKEFCAYRTVGSAIGDIAEGLGLIGFTPHQFRHAYVTNLDAGANPAHVSEYTGDGIGVLMDVYRHVTGRAFGADRAIIDAIGM